MTNKLFIVKYVFVDIDIDENVDEKISDTISKNLNKNLDKREDFDDMNFEFIFAQNICFFDVAKNVANKINSIAVFDEIKSEISDEIENFCENIANKTISLNVNETNFF